MGDPKLGRFDHLVVVMFENRSFDNVLGYLYQPGNVPRGQAFNGVAGSSYSNPVPPYINDGHTSVSVRSSPGCDSDMSNPNPDPGEEYPHVNTQLFGTADPASNEFGRASYLKSEHPGYMKKPWNNPAPGQRPTMDGFVHDYCSNFVSVNTEFPLENPLPTFDQYRIIMDCFGPESLPVINTLAREFAVYDAWFCAVPSQTFCNRSFFHASTSSGFLDNEPYPKWLLNSAQTIFNRLADAGVSWKVYYDARQAIPLTALIHAPMLKKYWKTHFATMERFYADVAAGQLPAYAFVEPRMLWAHNDYHPPAPLFEGTSIGATSDVRAGELLLHEIYSAVRAGASKTGSNALNTLLLVVFDEHGGTYDHVAPPPAVAPHPPPPIREYDFAFDRLGVRIPAIAISAYTQQNTVINREVHHGTVIRSLCEKYDLDALNERDRNAPDLTDALNLENPRLPEAWPQTVPLPVPAGALYTDPFSPEIAERPLNALERDIVGLAMTVIDGDPPNPADIPTKLGAAFDLMCRLASDAFGG
jgi:phospholipase C